MDEINLVEFCNWMTLKLAECSIRMTVLLEYLNLALDTCSWVHFITHLLLQGLSMMITIITDWFSVHYSKQLQGGLSIHCIILTLVGFYVISLWSFSWFLSNHKKALLRWLLHLHAKFKIYPVGMTDLQLKKLIITP